MLLNHRRVQRSQLRARRVDRHAVLETTEEIRHAMRATRDHGRPEMMRAGHHVRHDLRLGRVGTDGSSTPTITAEPTPRRIGLPTTDGSLLNAVVQNR